jgi:hypothetical protein
MVSDLLGISWPPPYVKYRVSDSICMCELGVSSVYDAASDRVTRNTARQSRVTPSVTLPMRHTAYHAGLGFMVRVIVQ